VPPCPITHQNITSPCYATLMLGAEGSTTSHTAPPARVRCLGCLLALLTSSSAIAKRTLRPLCATWTPQVPLLSSVEWTTGVRIKAAPRSLHTEPLPRRPLPLTPRCALPCACTLHSASARCQALRAMCPSRPISLSTSSGIKGYPPPCILTVPSSLCLRQ
jgi:hypothetical protein